MYFVFWNSPHAITETLEKAQQLCDDLIVKANQPLIFEGEMIENAYPYVTGVWVEHPSIDKPFRYHARHVLRSGISALAEYQYIVEVQS